MTAKRIIWDFDSQWRSSGDLFVRVAVIRCDAHQVPLSGQSRQLANVCFENVGSRRGLQETAKNPMK